MGWRVGLF